MSSAPGRFVVVRGASGAGKSTLSRNLGAALGLPVAELDAIFHLPGWQEPEPEEFRAKVTAWLDAHPDGWVVDGNYTSRVQDILMARADTVVWLRLPFHVVYPRLVRRTLRRAWTRELLWGTNRESWRQTLLSRDSMLVWGLKYWRPGHRRIEAAVRELPEGVRLVVLRSSREVASFLREAGESHASGPAAREL